MGLFGKKQEAAVAGGIEDLTAQIEAKKQEIEAKERDLQAQLEKEGQTLQDMEAALKEARWQEKLEKVDKELGPFYREQRKKEDEISQAINKVFNEAAKDVEKVNLMFKDLQELKKKISGVETQLIRSDDNHDVKVKETIEFKKAEIAREIEVAEEVKGGISLVREVNIALGIQDESDEELFGRVVNRLPIYAQNIYDEVRRAAGKPVRARCAELIRAARIPDPRIIRAREELKKSLEVLTKKELVAYEEQGDTFIITENIKEVLRR